jgi:hypothetical protein
VIDNAGFHSTKNIEVPQNIVLLRIPPYNPELNPCEQVWQYIKNRFKNQRFESMKSLKEWLSEMVCEMKPETIKSITGNHHFLKAFNNLIGITPVSYPNNEPPNTGNAVISNKNVFYS